MMTEEVKNMSEREVLEYFYTYIRTDGEYREDEKGRFFYATPDQEDFDYVEHSGSDILFMRFDIERYLNEKRN